MTKLWRSIVCLFRRDACAGGFQGDDTTDFLSDTTRRAREQEIAAWREVDRISADRREVLDFPFVPPHDGRSPR